MTEAEAWAIYSVLIAVGIVMILTVINLLILALSLKLYTEYFKERVKGKDKKKEG